MSSLKSGDESAFNELYERYSNRILLFMYKMLQHDEARAQDFTQDIFIKVIEKADLFDTSKSFKTWIFTIAANHCKNHFRNSRQILDIDQVQISEIKEESSVNLYDKNQFNEVLNTEINNLSSPYKETFILRYSEDLKLSEIAEILDCPVGTIKSRLNHATGILTKKLAPYKEMFYDKTKEL